MFNFSNDIDTSSLLIIFSYAPTGLGHLRVAEALYRGMPKGLHHVLLGSDDRLISSIHRIMSNHPLGHLLMEKSQSGIMQDIFTAAYRYLLRRDTSHISNQIEMILKQRIDRPKNIIVVATHMCFAHKLAAVKKQIEEKTGKKIFLVVQVTDDSPQHLWYVMGADLTTVPSHYTKTKLYEYAAANRLEKIPIEVLPYPISPELSGILSEEDFLERKNQTRGDNYQKINIIVPISGATVGLSYLSDLINKLIEISPRYHFFIISKKTAYSIPFLDKLEKLDNVTVSSSSSDREIVEMYKSCYLKNVIAFEITKPSEQSFKTFYTPQKIGGSILLFTHPVGQQEYDNLNFMKKHTLMPSSQTQNEITDVFSSVIPNQAYDVNKIKDLAGSWRAIRLPDTSDKAAIFIDNCLKSGLFEAMMEFRLTHTLTKKFDNEIGDDGVTLFWQKVLSNFSPNFIS